MPAAAPVVPASSLLARWHVLEERFAAEHYHGAGPGDLVIDGGGGRASLLLTAPHAVTHCRAGALKIADRGTGGLVRVLAETGDFAAIALGRYREDPAWERTDPLKTVLVRFHPRAVIDVHGMQDRGEGTDVVVGSGHHAALGVPYAEAVAAHLGAHGLVAEVDVRFDAARQTTVTRHVQDVLRVPAVQLELAPSLRPPHAEPERAERLLAALLTLEPVLDALERPTSRR